MSLVKIEFPPGLLRRGTIYETMGRWYDASLVRWHEGGMMPIGGWAPRTVTPITGKGRAILTWVTNDLTRLIAVGTEQKLYAATQSLTDFVDITPSGFTTGRADATASGGYGIGLYGAGTYGTPRVDANAVQDASMWTLDTFGELLVACMSDDGKLYSWDLNLSNDAAVISGAPTSCQGLVVTPERFLFALGAGGDKRKVQWADQETLTTWTPTTTNQAGDALLQTQGRILCGKRLRGQTLIFTDLDVHAATYQGPPFVYRIERVGESCGAISRGAVVAADTRAIWMGQSDFYVYDGFVAPIPCEIHDAVFGDFNRTQRSKVSGFHNSAFSEMWWFYPSAASTENDRVAVWDYHENHWSLHDMSEWTSPRLCGAEKGVFINPIMISGSGLAYDHETGSSYDSAVPFAESGPMEIGNGDRNSRVRRLIFDERTTGDVSLEVLIRDWNGDAETTFGPYTASNPTPVRFSGRQMRIKPSFTSGGPSARWGVLRADVLEGSKR